ncbi:hypothetical protein [Leptolyngbya sp. NIES-2104]|uniref:hypothetical protein n=1 Tax=Leptolyngbya sp. NIES-2104 TaxID=1552121 RepID=UPI0006ECCDDB|nr:hypothetical protein [Leptolyngbya sp. NIES-2104]GAP94935.1 hypothetical protein NIES2104_14530 [Leptolyngbya sp. NIES-2104]
MQSDIEAAQSRTEKAALLKKLTDFRSRNANRTGIIRLNGSDVTRLVELIGDRNPVLTSKLAGYSRPTNDITLLSNEIDCLLKIVQYS